MAFWNRKKTKQQTSIKTDLPIISATEFKKPACSHKYRDFHWYLEGSYDLHNFSIQVIEPYVCVWCGHRENRSLQTIKGRSQTPKTDMIAATRSLLDTYGDRIQPRALVEDEIADMQLVDRDYLRALAFIHPEKLVGLDEKAKVALAKS